jgi:hypothetical protein
VIKSIFSKRSGASSVKSSKSKAFIMSLKKELDEERIARLKIESEIAEIKKLNSEIGS